MLYVIGAKMGQYDKFMKTIPSKYKEILSRVGEVYCCELLPIRVMKCPKNAPIIDKFWMHVNN